MGKIPTILSQRKSKVVLSSTKLYILASRIFKETNDVNLKFKILNIKTNSFKSISSALNLLTVGQSDTVKNIIGQFIEENQ
jgi:hypothetical protein